MAGLNPDTPTPQSVTAHSQSRVLEVLFSDGAHFRIPFELMRIYSPSAEVQGHGPGQEVLQTGKINVKISSIEPVGNYAVRLNFDDDHNTGIYSWEYLRELALHQQEMWDEYLQRLQKAGARREPLQSGVQVVNIMPLKPH